MHARYRELARKYHPDLYKGGDAKFKSINEAYHAIIQGTAAMHMTTVAHVWPGAHASLNGNPGPTCLRAGVLSGLLHCRQLLESCRMVLVAAACQV